MPKHKKQDEGLKDKLVTFPVEVFTELEKDAARCRRTLNKHIEAILVAYLEIEDVELRSIEELRKQFKRENKPHKD